MSGAFGSRRSQLIVPSGELITDGVLCRWECLEGAGGDLFDSSGNGHDGEVVKAGYTTPIPQWSPGITPGPDYSLDMVLNEQSLWGGAWYPASSFYGDYTIWVWVKLRTYSALSPNTGIGGRLLSLGGRSGQIDSESTSNNAFVIYMAEPTSGKIGVGHEYGNGTNQFFNTTGSYISLDTGHCILVTKTAATKKFDIYVDGDFKEQLSYTTEASGGTDSWYMAGATGNANPAFTYTINGFVGPSGAATRVFTQSEITRIANRTG